MISFLKLVLCFLLSMSLSACVTKPPNVAQGLELYESGNFVEAYKMLNQLARAGDPQAQLALGVMYENGQGMQKDTGQAMYWFRQAAAQNNGSAQYLLALMLEQQSGKTAANMQQAWQWYEKAAINGHASAQFRMGQLEMEGIKAKSADPLKAIYWFGLAAAQGDPQAQLQLGIMIMQGRAGTTDRVLGYMWIDIAQGLGDNNTVMRALEAAKSLTPTELQIAKKLSTQCIKKNYQSCAQLPR